MITAGEVAQGASPPLNRYDAWPLIFVVVVTAMLMVVGQNSAWLHGVGPSAVAAVLIFLSGVPHGTLDVEIAAARFGGQTLGAKCAITAVYIGGAFAMWLVWMAAPALALSAFLIISIIHFSADWRGVTDPFLALTMGWALIAVPAFANPAAVAGLFEIIVQNGQGEVIAALLASSAIPALAGGAIYIVVTAQERQWARVNEALCCLVAAFALPPLIGFAVYFCGFHSPRHLSEAIRQSGPARLSKKIIIGASTFALSIGGAAWFAVTSGDSVLDTNMIRTAIICLSILTVPHVCLEQVQQRNAII
jgi:beta-carotene 15,15'-dioxygenase